MTMPKEVGKKYLAKIQDYRNCFGSESGKRVLYDLMKTHCVLSQTFDPSNLHATIFQEGKRNVILEILHKMSIDVKKLENIVTRGRIDGDFNNE